MSYTPTSRNSVFLSQPVMSGRTGRVPGLPYSHGRTGRVPGLPYNVAQTDGLRGLGDVMGGSGITIIGGAVALGVIGLLVWMGVRKSREEAELRARIVEKEGAAGLSRYEDEKLKRQVGYEGLNLVSSWLRPPMRRNRKRGRRSGRRTSRH